MMFWLRARWDKYNRGWLIGKKDQRIYTEIAESTEVTEKSRNSRFLAVLGMTIWGAAAGLKERQWGQGLRARAQEREGERLGWQRGNDADICDGPSVCIADAS
jgi:hypothetical protein